MSFNLAGFDITLPFTKAEWEKIVSECMAQGETPSHICYVILRQRFLQR